MAASFPPLDNPNDNKVFYYDCLLGAANALVYAEHQRKLNQQRGKDVPQNNNDPSNQRDNS